MKALKGLTAALGVAMAAACIAGATTARADDDWRGNRRDNDARYEYRDIRRDEQRLSDLEYRLEEQKRCHDWRGARETRRDIDRLREHIERDRREMRRRHDRW